MTDFSDVDDEMDKIERPPDPVEESAREHLRIFFEEHKEEVFYSRQLEVRNENTFFHWITNRAIRDLEAEGLVRSEWRTLSGGGTIKLLWHRGFRFYKRSAAKVVAMVEEYSNPNVSHALGLHGEMMILSGFAEAQFTQRGRETRSHQGKNWTESEHNLDFIFERDGLAYGVEVKNTLGYMDKKEFDIKIKLCQRLDIRPVFVVRAMPRTWIYELNSARGFGLIFRYQLYHWTHKELAKRVSEELGLPVDAPRKLHNRTMARFLDWHERQIA